MTPEQKRQGALLEFDELLSAGASVEKALATAAKNNEVKADILRTVVETHLGDLEAHRGKMLLRGTWESVQKENRALAAKLSEEAASSAEHTYYACCLNDPEHAGRPAWPTYIRGFLEHRQITDPQVSEAVREAFYAAIERLDRKHGTHTAHFRDY